MSTDQPEPAIRRVEDDDRPQVPEGVLRGIEDLAEGRTVDEEELEAVLKF